MRTTASLILGVALLVSCLAASSAFGDSLPVRTLAGHAESVSAVAFSPDGKLLASGSGDGAVKLWDILTGALLDTLTEHRDRVSSLAFSPDGRTLASGSWDTTVKLWDSATGDLLQTLVGHGYYIDSLAFSPDGKTLASSSSNVARLWDAATGELLRTLRSEPTHKGAMYSTPPSLFIAFLPDSFTLISGDTDSALRVWDVATGVLEASILEDVEDIYALDVSPDGRTVASGGHGGLKIWDTSTWTAVRTLSGHAGWVESVAFSPDGRTLASGSTDKAVKLWNVADGKLLSTLSGGTPVAFSPDGRLLASGSSDYRDTTIKLWDVEAILHPNRPPVASFTWQALSFGGTRLVVEPRTGDRISFDASASTDPDGSIRSYAWDWESDGTYDATSSVATAEQTFSASGSHRVTLRVTDDKGATAEVTKTIGIGVRQTPQASFSFAPSQPSIVDEVRFTDASTDPDGQVSSWSWEFGDGTTSTDRNPTHTYSRKSSFTVKLTVTDNDGLTGTKSRTLTVVNLSPDASFTFEPQAPVLGQTVRFDASTSTDRDGTLSSYAWDFNGDGKTDATGMEATWTFVDAKTYTVTLSVADSDGATGMANQDVTVIATPSGPPRFAQQWGLVIGVGDYEDPTIPDLTYTEADAQAFYDFLTGPQGGGFQKDHVRFLLNEQATSTAVKGAFSWLIDQAGADDLVVIYFAGHGGTAKDTSRPPDEADGVDEYLVTYDARTADLFSTAVRDDEMADWLASFQSDHVVVILDSCFASGATRSLEQTGTRAGPGNRVFTDLVGPGRLFLAASQEAELSYEDLALGHGVFTYYLLRGLGALNGTTTPEADADQDGRVTVEELRTYLEREVTRAKPQQHPLVTGDLALTRVALDGYGEPLVGEVTAIQGDYVIISLGSRHGVEVGDQFEIVRPYTLPDGSTAAEVRALVQIASILGPDRSACVLIESHFSVEIGDYVRPAQ
jgi:WD40 repeat protein/uncharacterized caspase-like protein